MTDDELRRAAEALIRLWQNDARTARVHHDVWPELGDAIDAVGEALAPPRARLHRDAAIRLQDLENGDVIRFNYPDRNIFAAHYNGRPWAIEEARSDVSRPRQNYWRVAGWRPKPGAELTTEHFAMDEHGEEEVIWLGKLSDFPQSGLPGGWPT